MILAIIASILAFVAHAKNWVRLEENRFRILSGIFYEDIPVRTMDSLVWVDKIPQMERKRGFSAWAFEKGTFADSLFPEKRIRVFVDNLRNQKIKMVYGDTLTLYVNYSDSLQTDELYQQLSVQKSSESEQFLKQK